MRLRSWPDATQIGGEARRFVTGKDIQGRLFHGRGCRGTPVKEHAAKVGVCLPPTPEGASKAQLRKHQWACRQKVPTAEERADDDPMKRKRHLALRAVTQAKYRKKKEAGRDIET